MTLLDTLTLFIIMVALALLPSSSVALVVTRSCSAGFANGAAAAAGIVTGDLVFVCLSVLGMSALAEVLGGLFLILKYIAAAYLLWFGIGLLKRQPPVPLSAQATNASSLSASFFAGFTITLGDVKAIYFYASLFPVFVDLPTITPVDFALILFVTLLAVGGVKLGYALGARKVMSLAGSPKIERRARTVAGGFMIGAGTYLIVKA